MPSERETLPAWLRLKVLIVSIYASEVPQGPHLLIEPGRHGDIEDTLLTLVMSRAAGGKKFDKMNVARVYFGNWLRDYCEFQSMKGWNLSEHLLTLYPSSSSNRCWNRQICQR